MIINYASKLEVTQLIKVRVQAVSPLSGCILGQYIPHPCTLHHCQDI